MEKKASIEEVTSDEIKRAEDFCRFRLRYKGKYDVSDFCDYMKDIFDTVYLTAKRLNDPALPYKFVDFLTVVHQFGGGTFREHIEKGRKSEAGLLAWEQTLFEEIERLDNTKYKDVNLIRLLDLSSLKTVVFCEMK